MKQSKFGITDLVYAGLFSLLIVVVIFMVGSIGYIPLFMPLIPFLTSLVSGPIFMLYSTRIKTCGMVFILGLVIAFVFSLSGHTIYIVPGCIIVSLLAEWILKVGGYKKVTCARWAYTVFSLYAGFHMIPIYFTKDAFLKALVQHGYGEAYANKLNEFIPNWSFLPVVILGAIGAYMGCTFGIKMLRKHFDRAGMS